MTDNIWLDANNHLLTEQKKLLDAMEAQRLESAAEAESRAEARDDARQQLALRAMLVSAVLSRCITVSDDDIVEAIDRADRVLAKLRVSV